MNNTKSRIDDDNKIMDIIKKDYNSKIEIWKVSDSTFKFRNQSDNIYYAKQYKKERSQILKDLSKINDDIGMPKSNIIDDDALIQIMEPAAGKHLGKYLAYWMLPVVWNYSQSKIKKIFFDLGEQVGRLHALTEGDETSLKMNDLRLDMHDAVINNKLSSNVINSCSFDKKTINKLNKKIKTFDGHHSPTSIIHGDLMLFHIYVSGSNVSLIDFGAAWRSHPLEDVATFISALDLYVRRLPYAESKQRKKLIHTFLKGYQETSSLSTINFSLLKVLQIIKLCSIFSYYINKVDRDSSRKLKFLKKIDFLIINKAICELINPYD